MSRLTAKHKIYAALTGGVFFATLLPLGFSGTNYGQKALLIAVALPLLSLAVFAFVRFFLAPVADSAAFRAAYRLGRRFVFTTPQPAFLAAIACLFAVVSLSIGYSQFRWTPFVEDSIAQSIHAWIFTQGALTLPAFPLPEFIKSWHLGNAGGKFYSQYPPGHSVLLALGQLVHAPWLVNPLLGAATCVAIFFLAKETHGARIARVAALLALASPMMLNMSAEFMNGATALLFATLFALFFVRSIRTHALADALLAGACIGYCFLTRPYTAMAFAFPFALYLACGLRWRTAGAMALGFLPLALACLWFNAQTTGNPFTFGYETIDFPSEGFLVRPGFGLIHPDYAVHFNRTEHTLLVGLKHMFNDLNGMQFFLFRWPVPSLLFVAAAFMLPARRARWNGLLLAVAGAMVAANIFYFIQQYCFGVRYLYETSGVLIILTAYGIARAPLLWRVAAHSQLGAGALRRRVALLVALCMLAAIPLSSRAVDKVMDGCMANAPSPVLTLLSSGLKNAVVFIPPEQYEPYALFNPPSAERDIIAVRDLGEEKNRELLALFPGRDVYRLSPSGELSR